MAFTTITAEALKSVTKKSGRKTAKTGNYVRIYHSRTTSSLILPASLQRTLGETTHVAIDLDTETNRAVIRPSVWGEVAFKLYAAGGGSDTPRIIHSAPLARLLGLDQYKGKLPARAKDGQIVVTLKRPKAKIA